MATFPSKIANKRRPKKSRPPYKKFVYKSSYTTQDGDGSGGSGDEIAESSENWQDFNTKTNANISLVYVLTQNNGRMSRTWPRSQFEKVDVLHWCLFHDSDEFRAQVLRQQEELRRQNEKGTGLTFPLEVIVHLFEIMLLRGQLTPKFLRLSKLFYLIVAPMLYRQPHLRGDNFLSFVDTINGNKTIGEYIHHLDLSNVNQSGKNAYVAKLLKRSRPSLRSFTAPQTSFGLAPLISLRSCKTLERLDLRLVSETLNLEELFLAIRQLENLTHLSFPRSSIEINDYSNVKWPPKLEYLRVSGGISDDFLIHSEFPPTIAHMEFAHCPKVKHLGFEHLIEKFGYNLKTLKIQFPMPGLMSNSLDTIFIYCPSLLVLELSVDYISADIFNVNLLPMYENRPLRALYIDSSGMLGTTDKLDPIDLALALDDGRLPNVRNIRCTAKLGWNPDSDVVSYIAEELEERGGGLYIGY